jgi:DNA polymerase elongation subunit (family B)
MVLWLVGPEGKHCRLIDRSFTPCFYVHGPELRLTPLAQALAARAAVKCTWTEKTNIWDGGELRVLEVAVRHPTQFAALVRFVHQYDSSLRLYNSDLMLAPMYCWEKGVFPLAKVEVEELGAGDGGLHKGARGWGLGTRAGTAPGPHPLLPSPAGEGNQGWGPEVSPVEVRAIRSCDDEWATNYELPPLQIMRVRLEGPSNVDPQHGRRGGLEVEIDGEWRLLDDSEEPVAVGFERLLRAHDPDMILSEWGDSTLFPALLRQARKLGLTLSLNRDAQPVERRRARSYMSYGRILFKGSTTTLFGRLHVDTQNSFIADQCDLEGLWELVRVTKLPVQYCARTSTGTGISYMQMELAYGDGVLIPEQKAEPESPKHPDELLRADRGGLVFLPRLGFFTNVGELDFISEFPSIMARFNISPETVNCGCCPEAPRIPELGYRICQRRRGITSRVVERLIRKRQEYKRQMAGDRKGGVLTPPQAATHPSPQSGSAAPPCGKPPAFRPKLELPLSSAQAGRLSLPACAEEVVQGARPSERRSLSANQAAELQVVIGRTDRNLDNLGKSLPLPIGLDRPTSGADSPAALLERRHAAKERRAALKWLLVCCFGYTGYKNARFGKIEAHEAINALAREKLLVAKETAEARGYRVLHALVDSLYVQKEDATREDYENLSREIEQRTGLPMALEAVYRYVVFLPSKQSPEIPVPNRFFCVPEEGELKVRGLECRKRDTPPLVARMQREALAILAEAHDFQSYGRKLEEAREVLARYLARLEAGSINLEELVINRRLTRAPHDYKQASATAIAAKQLERGGVKLRPGETLQYIITDAEAALPDDRVRAWTLWEGWYGYDVKKYQEALQEAFEAFEHFVVLRTAPRGAAHPLTQPSATPAGTGFAPSTLVQPLLLDF